MVLNDLLPREVDQQTLVVTDELGLALDLVLGEGSLREGPHDMLGGQLDYHDDVRDPSHQVDDASCRSGPSVVEQFCPFHSDFLHLDDLADDELLVEGRHDGSILEVLVVSSLDGASNWGNTLKLGFKVESARVNRRSILAGFTLVIALPTACLNLALGLFSLELRFRGLNRHCPDQWGRLSLGI